MEERTHKSPQQLHFSATQPSGFGQAELCELKFTSQGERGPSNRGIHTPPATGSRCGNCSGSFSPSSRATARGSTNFVGQTLLHGTKSRVCQLCQGRDPAESLWAEAAEGSSQDDAPTPHQLCSARGSCCGPGAFLAIPSSLGTEREALRPLPHLARRCKPRFLNSRHGHPHTTP